MVSIICRAYRSGSNYHLTGYLKSSVMFSLLHWYSVFSEVQVSITIKGYIRDLKKKSSSLGMWSSKFQLGICCGVSAKFQENSACWQVGWIVIKAPATLRTWNRHHLVVHGVSRSVLGRENMCQILLSIILYMQRIPTFTWLVLDQKLKCVY